MQQASNAGEPATSVELIDTAHLPDGGHLRLLRRGDDFSIRFGSEELMGNAVADQPKESSDESQNTQGNQ